MARPRIGLSKNAALEIIKRNQVPSAESRGVLVPDLVLLTVLSCPFYVVTPGRGPHPMHKTDDQKKAALQQRIAILKAKVRRIEKREAEAERRARNHRLIISGAIVEDLLPKFRDTAFAAAFIAAVREHIEAHPADADGFAELLDRLTESAGQREAAE